MKANKENPLGLEPVEARAAANPTVVPLVVISPVRNEAEYLRLTLNSMVAQTVRPMEWIIVDDGSQDDTPEIVRAYAEQYPFIRLIPRTDRGFRHLGGGVIAAFEFGMEHIGHTDYRYLAKLDGDMSFGPRYLERMFEKLDGDPTLAAVSGKVFRREQGRYIAEPHIEEQVAGQFKLYRREAYEDIGGFVRHLGWDGIDVHMARMKGWRTLSYLDPQAWLWHHRIMGSSDRSLYVGRLRWGRGNWYMGYHPLYAVAAGVNRMREKPYVIGGLLMIFGYFWSAFRRLPRYDNPAFRQSLQQWQLERLRASLGRKPR